MSEIDELTKLLENETAARELLEDAKMRRERLRIDALWAWAAAHEAEAKFTISTAQVADLTRIHKDKEQTVKDYVPSAASKAR